MCTLVLFTLICALDTDIVFWLNKKERKRGNERERESAKVKLAEHQKAGAHTDNILSHRVVFSASRI